MQFFTGWVVLGITWLFASPVMVGFIRLWESRKSLSRYFGFIIGDLTGNRKLNVVHGQPEVVEESLKAEKTDCRCEDALMRIAGEADRSASDMEFLIASRSIQYSCDTWLTVAYSIVKPLFIGARASPLFYYSYVLNTKHCMNRLYCRWLHVPSSRAKLGTRFCLDGLSCPKLQMLFVGVGLTTR